MSDSHSAQFGLEGRDQPTQNAGSGPGSGIEGTSGHGGHKTGSSSMSGMGEPEKKVGALAQGASDHSRPGAGSSTMEPSQGTGKLGGQEQQESLKDKLNPFKP